MPYAISNIFHKKDSFGLDIGVHSLKVCQLKKSGRLTKLIGYGSAPIPKDIVIEGIISDPDVMAKIIKDLLKNMPWGEITADRVVASLPESKIFTRILELPEMDKKQMEEAVRWEAEQYIPVPVADLYLDWEIIHKIDLKKAAKQKGVKIPKEEKPVNEIMLVATPKSIVDSYLQVFKILDLEPAAIEMSLAAMTRALVPPKTSGAVAIVNIGANATDAGVVYNNALRLSGSTPTGGDHISDAVANKLKIALSEADEIKKKFGITEWGLYEKVIKAVEPTLDIITGEAERIIKYYDERIAEAKEHKIEQVLLTGGTANMPGLTQYIQKKLNLPVEIGNPWSNITVYPLKPVPKSEVPVYATAIGLALRGVFEYE